MCGVTSVTGNCTRDTGAVVVGRQASTAGYSVLGLASYTITPCSPGTNQTIAFTQIGNTLLQQKSVVLFSKSLNTQLNMTWKGSVKISFLLSFGNKPY